MRGFHTNTGRWISLKKLLIPFLIGLMAFLYIFIVPHEPLAVKITFKLIPMALIIIYAFRHLPHSPTPAMRLVMTGLFFCMLGDGVIAVTFTAGLGAFLVGHLFYLSGFLKLAQTTKRRLAYHYTYRFVFFDHWRRAFSFFK